MKITDFRDKSPGKRIPTVLAEYLEGPMAKPTETHTVAFVPDPLPPKIDWKAVQLERFD